jgi:hypothetical protein
MVGPIGQQAGPEAERRRGMPEAGGRGVSLEPPAKKLKTMAQGSGLAVLSNH